MILFDLMTASFFGSICAWALRKVSPQTIAYMRIIVYFFNVEKSCLFRVLSSVSLILTLQRYGLFVSTPNILITFYVVYSDRMPKRRQTRQDPAGSVASVNDYCQKRALEVVSSLDVAEIGGDILPFGKLVDVRLALSWTDRLAVHLAFGIDAIDLQGRKFLDLLAIL